MNKRNVMVLPLAALMLLSCGSKEKKVPFEYIDASSLTVTQKCVYGVLGSTDNLSSVSLKDDSGESRKYDFSQAISIIGQLRQGDRFALTLDANDDKIVSYAANISMLVGVWVEPSPLNEGDYQGIALEEGGAASSVNLQSIIYRGWALGNGKLQLSYVTEGRENSTEAESDWFDVAKLTQDSLVIRGKNVEMQYRRRSSIPQKEEDEMKDFVNDDPQDYSAGF